MNYSASLRPCVSALKRLRLRQGTALAVCLLSGLLALAGCAGEPTEVARSPLPTPTLPPPTSTPLPENATVGARVRARGYLVVGVRYDLQPFGTITDEGEVAGFGVDAGRELARRWLGDTQAVRFRQVRSDTAIEHLQARDVDIVITALAHTQDREAGADFSLPYFADGQALLIRAADAPFISGPASLEGRPVGVVAWAEATDALQAAVPFTLTLQTYDRFDVAVAALGRGEVDAVADMRHRLFWGRSALAKAAATEGAIVGQYTAVPVAFAFPQNDPCFADLVNQTLQEMVADGTLADLYARWFGPEPLPAVERWPGEEIVALADCPLVANVPDTIAAVQSRGRLAVALIADRYPFAYVDEAGLPAGYEVNLVLGFARRWLGDAAVVDFIPVAADVGAEVLLTGQADLLVGRLAHTRAAEMEMDFSQTIYVAGEGLLVWAGGAVTDLASLNAQQVAVVEGGHSREVLLAAAQAAGVSLTVLPQPTLEAAIASLTEGQVMAVAGERTRLLGPAYRTDNLAVLPLRLTQVSLALGLPQGDSAFRDLVNLTLQAMKADGEFDALYTAWFDDAPPVLEMWPGAPYRALRLEVAAP